jgi:exodeoxyribonuclease VII large subunit
MEKITLSELQERIGNAIGKAIPDYVWITAELGEIKEHPNGHCYLDLIDYSPDGNGVLAKARAVIWSSSYKILKPFFSTSTGSPLQEGMHLLMRVQVQYSNLYGLNLIVNDIDPSFTVGELELLKQKTIARLKQEGMFDMNSTLEMPLLPRKFAIISSRTAAGYIDFTKHLMQNEEGFCFYMKLFPAPMQGEEAPAGIIKALDAIAGELAQNEAEYDAVVLVRGGGASMDLSCFDDYNLAVNIAQFPIPVITGVGHDIDFHVCDMVANKWLKTPTAVADYIIEIFQREAAYIGSLSARLALALSGKIKEQQAMLMRAGDRIANTLGNRILMERNKLDGFEIRLKSALPQEIISKGFGVIYVNEKRVKLASEIGEGDNVEILMKDGSVSFKALNIKRHKRV